MQKYFFQETQFFVFVRMVIAMYNYDVYSLIILVCLGDHCSKKTAFNNVPPNSTWNKLLVGSNDRAQRFSNKKLLVRLAHELRKITR